MSNGAIGGGFVSTINPYPPLLPGLDPETAPIGSPIRLRSSMMGEAPARRPLARLTKAPRARGRRSARYKYLSALENSTIGVIPCSTGGPPG
ncbi:hypothetical protein CLV63_105256 [Murinocardiopsis flavida]|uniref:Uncharacterized protein n=1 Tax=Murinocardiopsis flavida TaxID=645275 RepID=A0A2P8DMY8_9ACTN|nr:hypothetical protein CLV63_105256 [Murinocardiopsis flavida]